MKKLNGRDLLALGFMTLALFLGAGNIIYPPLFGLQQGANTWYFACGFLITAVGLPVLTIVALARVNGTIQVLSQPIGRVCSVVFAVVCYLAVGPLFATPRTATVSYEIGVQPFLSSSVQGSRWPLAIYSLCYFLVTMVVSFYPGRLLDTVGKVLAPVKVIAILFLGGSAFVMSAYLKNSVSLSRPGDTAFGVVSSGISNGYLTMDTLGALVFGIVIVRAIQSRGVTDKGLVTRYAIMAGLMAGLGLAVIYIMLFRLGIDSQQIAPGAETGAQVLSLYVNHVFGIIGNFILAFLIIIACMVTSVGLTCACGEYFGRLLNQSEKLITVIMVIFSMIVSNLGLKELIRFSEPLLYGLGPLCVVLVLLSLGNRFWHSRRCVIVPGMIAALLFGIAQAVRAVDWSAPMFAGTWLAKMPDLSANVLGSWPLYSYKLEWVMPIAVVAGLSIVVDVARGLVLKRNSIK